MTELFGVKNLVDKNPRLSSLTSTCQHGAAQLPILAQNQSPLHGIAVAIKQSRKQIEDRMTFANSFNVARRLSERNEPDLLQDTFVRG